MSPEQRIAKKIDATIQNTSNINQLIFFGTATLNVYDSVLPYYKRLMKKDESISDIDLLALVQSQVALYIAVLH